VRFAEHPTGTNPAAVRLRTKFMAVDGEVVQGIVAGRYRLVRIQGQGATGRVWLAHDELLAREVTVKEVMPIAGVAPGRTDLWERAIREARTAGRLRHPNVTRVYDVHFADGRPWIVTEYVEGRTLLAAVRDDGPFDAKAAAAVGLALLDGLAAAHAAGVLHRDVAPRNVLLTPEGQVLLGDFGVAVFQAESLWENTTREDVLLVSPAYVAPERVTSGESTTRTDLWSLGATVYLAVEGRPPYERPTPIEQLTALTQDPPDEMRRAGALEPVLTGLLRRDPDERLTAEGARPLFEAALFGPRRGSKWRIAGQRRPVIPPAPTPLATTPPTPEEAAGAGISPSETPQPSVPVPALAGAATAAAAVDVDTDADAGSRTRTVAGERGGSTEPEQSTKARTLPGRPALAARRTLIMAGLAVLIIGVVAVGAWAATRPAGGNDRPAAEPSVSAAQAYYPAPLRCTSGTAGGGETGPVMSPAPASPGWIPVEGNGFRTRAPAGWQRATNGPVVCFLDPAGQHGFTVDPTPPPGDDRVAYWTERERAMLAEPGTPAGYRRITISVALYKQGAADWEYTFDENGTRWHTLRRAFAVGDSRRFVVSWTAPDAGWDAASDGFRSVVDAFDSR
jgi:hypothetical protein